MDVDLHGPSIPRMLGVRDELPVMGTGKAQPINTVSTWK